MNRLSKWRARRSSDEIARKALRHAGRLSSGQILDQVDTVSMSLGQAVSVLREQTDPEYRYQILCDAKASADVASILLEKLVELQELRLSRANVP